MFRLGCGRGGELSYGSYELMLVLEKFGFSYCLPAASASDLAYYEAT